MSWKKRTIFKRCVSILLIIALIPIADFSGVVAYAETADNGLLKNITLKAEVNAQGNVELQWNKVTGASKYVINKNGDELTSIDSSDIESNNSKDLLYIDKETEANKEYTYIVVAFNTNDDKLGTCDAVNVKMPEELVISGNYTLDRNMTVYNLKQTWGTLNLNGYTLNVCKEYSHNGGILSVGEGIINCYGKYTSASNAEIVMDNANGKITFYEDITWGSSNGSRIENGVIEAKKDVSYTDGGRFVAGKYHKFIMSGNKKQILSTNDNIQFNTLEIKNTSDDGVYSIRPLRYKELITKKDNADNEEDEEYKLVICDEEGVEGKTLEEDKVIDGDYVLTRGTLDLNGHKLTINGNLIHIAGDIKINGGELIVKKDYRLESRRKVEVKDEETDEISYEIKYDKSFGRLYMTNAADKVTVEGSYINNAFFDSDGMLTDGVFELKGDFTVKNTAASMAFYAKENHVFKLSGDKKQEVVIKRNNIIFSNVIFANSSSDGISLPDSMNINTSVDDTDNKKIDGYIGFGTSTTFANNTYKGDVILPNNYKTSSNIEFKGNVKLYGYLIVDKDMTIKGDFICNNSAEIKIQEAKLTIEGDFNYDCNGRYADIYMQSEESHILVKGNMTFYSYYSVYLANGTIEVKKDVTLKSGFGGSSSQRLLLSGDTKQVITTNGCSLGILELSNTSEDGVVAKNIIIKEELINNNTKFKYEGVEGEMGWTLSKDETYDKDLLLLDDTLNLNGHTLTINGDLNQIGGTIKINGGKLIVKGDMTIANVTENSQGNKTYSGSYGKLIMTDASDYIRIDGSLYFASRINKKDILTEGTIEVKKDVTIDNYNSGYFYASNNNTLKLSGSEKQILKVTSTSIDYANINNIDIANTSEDGVEFVNSPYIKGKIVDNSKKNTGYIRIGNSTIVKDNIYNIDIQLIENKEFTEKSTFAKNLNISSVVTISNDVVVKGNYIQGNGKLVINKSKLTVEGNVNVYWDYTNGIVMKNEEDYIYVGGDFTYSPGRVESGSLTNGTIEVKGNITSNRDLYPSGNHRFLLSGDKKQTVDIASGCKFAILELNNHSEEGIYCKTLIVKDKLIRNGCNIQFGDMKGEVGWTLTKDEKYEGDLIIIDDVLDLNGHTLTVTGDIVLTAGKLNVNGGKLIVEGDFRQQSRTGEEGSYNYSNAMSRVIMTNPEDKIIVNGNFYQYSTLSGKGDLTDGVLEIKGNMTVERTASDNFYASDNHTVILSGDKKQSIYFYQYNWNYSQINNIKMANTSSDGIEFKTYFLIAGKISQEDNVKVTGRIGIGSTTSFEQSKYVGDILVYRGITFDKEFTIDGNIETSSATTINKKLTVNGNMSIGYNGNVTLNNSKLIVNGDMSVYGSYSGINMTHEDDYILVTGNLTYSPEWTYHYSYNLSNGVFEVKGDITSTTGFGAGSNHKFILSGDKLQTLSLYDGAKFATLELQNYSDEGVYSEKVFDKDTLIRNGCKLTYGTGESVIGWSLKTDYTCEGDMLLVDDTIDLQGHTLTIRGDLIHAGGNIKINNGKLVVKGNYIMMNRTGTEDNYSYSTSKGKIIMTNEDDAIEVYGDYIEQISNTSQINISNGTLTLYGNVEFKNSNISITGDAKVIMSGSEEQNINMNYAQIATLINNNDKELNIAGIINVTTMLQDNKGTVSGKEYVNISSVQIIKDGKWSGNVSLRGYSSLENDLIIGGTLYLYATINVNDNYVYAKNITLYSDLHTDKGNIVCANDMIIERYGCIYMTEEEANVLVGSDFTIKSSVSHNGKLTNGTLEIRGNFIQSYDYNFIATDNHKTILGKKKTLSGSTYIQTIEFNYYKEDITKFNKLVLKKADNKYQFSHDIEKLCNELIRDVEDDTAPTPVTSIEVKSCNESSVVIEYDGATDDSGVLGYEIYRDSKKIATTSSTTYTDKGLKPATKYIYEVYPFDEFSNMAQDSPSVTATTLKDTTAPNKPENVEVYMRSGSAITIRWDKAEDNVGTKGYRVYRNEELIADNIVKTQYKDEGLEKNVTYTYEVEAYDEAGNYSEKSSKLETEVVLTTIIDVTPENESTIGGNSVSLKAKYENVGNTYNYSLMVEYMDSDDKWVEITSEPVACTDTSNPLEQSITCDWNIRNLSGKKNVRYTIIDMDGNTVSKEVTYDIDKTAPELPEEFEVSTDNGVVTLEWCPSTSEDVKEYNIYEYVNSEYELIKTVGYETFNYKIKDMEEGTKCEYAIKAVDNYDNESNYSEIKSVIVDKDKEAPIVEDISPKQQKINSNKELIIKAKDNKKVGHIEISYALKGTENWIYIDTIEADKGVAKYIWDTTPLEDGDYTIGAIAVDSSDNKSEERYTMDYTVDNTGISKIILSDIKVNDSNVVINWEENTEEDLDYYVVEQLDGTEWKRLDKIQGVTTYNAIDLMPLTNYVFRVVGYDKLGNRGIESEEISVTTTEDVTKPIISKVYPAESRYKGNIRLQIYAIDNVELDYGVFLISYDNKNFTEISTVQAPSGKKNYVFETTLNTNVLDEGNIYIKYQVYDKKGNNNKIDDEIIGIYSIDRTAPKKADNLNVIGNEGYVGITWEGSSDGDVEKYAIYRASISDGIFKKYDETTTSRYSDLNIKVGSTYKYKVTAIDIAGNESEYSNEVITTVVEDTEKPIIKAISPNTGSVVSKNPTIQVLAIDNALLSKVVVEYKSTLSTSDNWRTLEAKYVNARDYLAQIKWNTNGLSDGNYLIRAYAIDFKENKSDVQTVMYTLDTSAPSDAKIKATPGEYCIDISITVDKDDDIEKYEIYRKCGEEDVYEQIAETEKGTYKDKDVQINTEYTYYAKMYDKAGNVTKTPTSSAMPLDEDTEKPVAVLSEKYICLVGKTIQLDGSASTDNVGIVDYSWDMGNGDKLNGIRPTYVYEEAGTYDVKLTVTDAKGNTSSSTTKFEVKEDSEYGEVKIRVKNEKSKLIPYAAVYIKISDDENLQLKTDSNGEVSIALKEGSYKVAVYSNGYTPREYEVEVEKNNYIEYDLVVCKSQVVTGMVSVRKLTLEEIIDAGVDLTDISNYHQFSVSLSMTYDVRPIPTEYRIICSNNGKSSSGLKSNGPVKPEEEQKKNNKTYVQYPNLNLEKIGVDDYQAPPIIVVMSVSAGMSWLKDIYDVTVSVCNGASEPFEIDKAKATLNLPKKGMSLAVTDKEQSLTQNIDTIKGESVESATWIVRGDYSGSYKLSADFEGKLMPFNEKITAHFKTDEDIVVSTGEGLTLTFYINQYVYMGETYKIPYTITNESSRTLYKFRPNFGTGLEGAQEEKAEEYVIIDKETGEGQKVTTDEVKELLVDLKDGDVPIIIPCSEYICFDKFEPNDSYSGVINYGVPIVADKDDYYLNLIDYMVNVIQGENLGVNVNVVVHEGDLRCKYETIDANPPLFGDPIDISNGGYTDTIEALALQEGINLEFSADYNSSLASCKGELGYGWSHSYESKIEYNNGMLDYYTSAYGSDRFIEEDAYNNRIYGTVESDGTVKVSKNNKKGDTKYVPLSSNMKGYSIIKHENGSYTVNTPNGSELKYDALGRMTKITDENKKVIDITYKENQKILTDTITGKYIKLNYNDKELITSAEDSCGRIVSFSYDENSCLTSYTNAIKETVSYTYDNGQRITKGIDNEGIIFVDNTYDEEGRVTKQLNGSKKVITLKYEDEGTGTKVTTTDADGNSSYAIFNSVGRITQEKNTNGCVTKYGYDNYGNRTYAIVEDSIKKAYSYDEKGNLIQQEDIDGTTTTYTYDDKGNVLTMTSSNGTSTKMTYNDANLIASQTDSKGLKTVYEYNDNGQLIKEKVGEEKERTYEYTDGMLTAITDYLGNKTSYVYDTYGNKIAVIDPEGNKTSYEYDLLGRVIKETNAENNSKTYKYNSYGNVSQVIDEKGNVTTNTYDVDGNLSKVTYADGKSITYTYSDNGTLKRETYQDGTYKEYVCDGTENILEEKLTDGTKITYEYDKLGRVIKEKGEQGREVSYQYNIKDKITKETYADGSYMEYTYDSNSRKTSQTDSKGHKTKYEYDIDGNLTKVTDTLGKTIEYTYDTYGNQIEVKDKKGNVTKYEYDLNGNCTKIIDALGHATTYVYDKLNRNVEVRTTKEEKELVAKIEYDKLGRVSKEIDELGNETTMSYDEKGNLLTVTDANGNVVNTNEYNNMDQLTTTKDALGNVTTYSYNDIGALIKQVEYLNTESERKYEYSYDKLNRMTKTVDPLEGQSEYEYDELGNIVKQIDPNGGETTYTYDVMGRKTSELNAIGSKSTYTYDALGLLKESENARNQKTTYTYDGLGRIKETEDEAGYITYTYDDNDNVEEVIEATSDGKTYKTVRTYDELNRVKKYTDYKGNTVKYSYDELGNLISLTYPGGEIVRYEYYDNGYLHKVIDGNNRTTVYEYDLVGNLLKKTRPNETTEERVYDKAYQLVEQIEKDAKGEEISHLTYTYDTKGNIIKTEGYKKTEEGISKLESAEMKYDKANRLIEYKGEEVKYDADGNMIYGPVDGKLTELEYDSRNRLIRAGEITYEYDSENNRIATNTPEYREEYIHNTEGTIPQVLVISRYKVEDDKTTSDENVEKVATYSETAYEKTTCYYGTGLEYEITDSTVKYHLYNNIGNTIALTNSKGKIVKEYTYGSYGELLSGDSTATKFLYNGQYGIQTDINNMYYMRSRYYNPEVKRFINQDTLLGDIKNSQSLNRYAYVQGNPITYTDPFGTNPLKAAGKLTSKLVHGLLDGVAFFGLDVADLANAGLYLLEGNKDEAKLYLLAAIPIAGGLVAGAKGIRKLTKLSKTAKVVDRVGDAASDAYRSGRKINNYVDDVGEVLSEGKKNSSKGRKLVDKLKDKAKKVKNKVTPKKKNGVGVVGVPKSGKVVDEVVESGSKAVNEFKVPEIITNSKGELTNGTYTLNQQDMLIHVNGKNPNKSQFLYDVDANKAVLDASVYADANNLWVPSSGNRADFANKAKVPVANGYVGVTGKGELTTYINVYRTKTGYIHGCPGNP